MSLDEIISLVRWLLFWALLGGLCITLALLFGFFLAWVVEVASLLLRRLRTKINL